MPQLAQVNIARFTKVAVHPDNQYFFDNLDRVNAIAESMPGFVWRMKDEGNNATELQAFDDPNVITNMSVWERLDDLFAFVYQNKEHKDIMRRRREWFEHLSFHLALWWVPTGHLPSVEEAKAKLTMLEQHGPSAEVFTFAKAFTADGHPYRKG